MDRRVVGAAVCCLSVVIVVLYAAAVPAVPPVTVGSERTATLSIVRVLCFGDSLTYGLTVDGKPHPYAPHLAARLASLGLVVPVESVGHSGWTSTMMKQLPSGLPDVLATAASSQQGQYASVALLAGTNDLARMDASPESIASNIQALHELAWAAGVQRTVAIGIPPISESRGQTWDFEERRSAVNRLLADWAASSAAAGRVRYIPCPVGLPDLSVDGVHFTPDGYQKLGTGVADAAGAFLVRGTLAPSG
jgi:lysophospholipase L1-like esterase